MKHLKSFQKLLQKCFFIFFSKLRVKFTIKSHCVNCKLSIKLKISMVIDKTVLLFKSFSLLGGEPRIFFIHLILYILPFSHNVSQTISHMSNIFETVFFSSFCLQ